jgi:UBX domain-containing protein 1
LGSDEVDSTFIPDPNVPPLSPDAEETTVIRHLTFWRDGFSVEDGELMRYDDPANDQILADINEGYVPPPTPNQLVNHRIRRAPPQILNVLTGQSVELRVAKRLSENYTPAAKRPAAAFSGTGNRLGSPAVAPEASGVPMAAMPGSFPDPASARTSASGGAERPRMNTIFEVDQTLPTTSVQIRLADGTRYNIRTDFSLPCAFLLTIFPLPAGLYVG